MSTASQHVVDVRKDQGRNLRALFVVKNLYKLRHFVQVAEQQSSRSSDTQTTPLFSNSNRGTGCVTDGDAAEAAAATSSRSGTNNLMNDSAGCSSSSSSAPGCGRTASYVSSLETRPIRWNDLLARGIVEYVDKEEENNLVIAQDWLTLERAGQGQSAVHAHANVHGSAMYGVRRLE